jgi:DNA (cytosine-5)-methyltransferase 1
MGYKLAGFEHLGGVEIDQQVAAVYKANHKPRYLYTEDIRKFNKRTDLHDELFNLDLLDGSPPCSSFSMAGNREKDWGKEKVFREGQAMQRLDDLFFDYISLAKRLQPKVVIAENVKGMLQGNAKAYVKRIKAEFEAAGYIVQLFLLNAASMGVPQRRERVFFVCQRKDMGWSPLVLNFKEKPVTFKEIYQECNRTPLSNAYTRHWENAGQDGRAKTAKGNTFGYMYRANWNEPLATITAGSLGGFALPDTPVCLSANEIILAGSFPVDYNFTGIEPSYLIGMSVPPVMTAQVAHQVYLQWLSKQPTNSHEKA